MSSGNYETISLELPIVVWNALDKVAKRCQFIAFLAEKWLGSFWSGIKK
jgi:hypothetical protein